jgi:Na+-translocating ferredoxin:NAD+ oxidoreductase RnfG subunit
MMRKLLLMAVVTVWALGSARAERYLTVAEAQKLCFPEATRYEEKNLNYTVEQARAIERQSGIKVRTRSGRVWLAHGRDGMDGVLFADHVMGKHEVIDYVVAITLEGAVRQIEVLEYRESHGGEIRGAKWRAQFRGKTSNSGLKLNKDIYNISGATMSCRHVTEGVKRVLATFEVVVRPTLPARGGVQHSASTRD